MDFDRPSYRRTPGRSTRQIILERRYNHGHLMYAILLLASVPAGGLPLLPRIDVWGRGMLVGVMISTAAADAGVYRVGMLYALGGVAMMRCH